MKKCCVRRVLFLFTVLFYVLMLGACRHSSNSMDSAGDGTEIIFTDALEHEVRLKHVERTAVLSESLAQAWLLAGGELAGTSEDAKEILDAHPDMVNLGALKTPSAETLMAEGMELVILSSAIPGHVKLYDTLEKAGIVTAYFDIETFEDYKAMMGIFTDSTGNKKLYEENVTSVEKAIEEQIARADGSSPKILLLRAYSTGVRAKNSDTMTGKMLLDLGCVNIADSDGGLLEDLNMEAILVADPDFIFVTTMGSSQEAALSMVDELLASNPAWQGLTAVKDDKFYVLEKELFHNKPNNRWGESYEILADILYDGK